MSFTQADWEQAVPRLLQQVLADQFTIHKRSASGDVLCGEIVLGGKPVPVFIKRPRRKYLYRYLTSVGPFTRVRRMWLKAWKLSVRDIPTEWPLLMMEKRTLGYMTDGLIVFEHVPGSTLADSDLDSMPTNARQMLFHRIGRILRLIDQHGFAYFDSKAQNWIVQADEKLGPTPVIIDVDGIRHYPSPGSGIRRLLRSMREHAQYTPADSYAICKGYLPYGRLDIEDADEHEREEDFEEPRA
jgi:hypothetical protein